MVTSAMVVRTSLQLETHVPCEPKMGGGKLHYVSLNCVILNYAISLPLTSPSDRTALCTPIDVTTVAMDGLFLFVLLYYLYLYTYFCKMYTYV